MNVHSEFFRFDTHAHFVAFVVHVGALFEKRADTINIPSLVEEAGTQTIDPGTLASARSKLLAVEPSISKVMILRSNLFAHRSASMTYADVFARASVSADELRSLSDASIGIAQLLAEEIGLVPPFRNDMAVEHLQGLIDGIGKPSAA